MEFEAVAPNASLKGLQEPRIASWPTYTTSAADEVIKVGRLAGIHLDPWQEFQLRHGLGESPDWKCPQCTYRSVIGPLPCPDHPWADLIHPWAAFEVCSIVPRQNGKALGVDTPILTTEGWKTMGTVQVGDSVYGADGDPTRVIATSETFSDHGCYEIEFHDGTTFVADEGHQWRVYDKDAGWKTLTTRAIAETRWGHRRRDTGRMEYRYRVQCDAAVNTSAVNLPIDPYLFGYWLGDGTSRDASLTVAHGDVEHVRAQIARAGYTILSDHPVKPGIHRVSFTSAAKAWGAEGITSRLRELGVLGNKHIPEIYLSASIEQRQELLAGLLDSDGSIGGQNKSPRVEFSACSQPLARDFFRLARSLGARTRMLTADAAIDGRVVGTRYRICWTPTTNPFRMARKAARWRAPASGRQQWMSITGVKKVDAQPVRCIQVQNPDHLYLVGRTFIPTHNSEILIVRMLGGLYVFDEGLQIYSAHLFDTAIEIFLRLKTIIENTPDLYAEVKRRGRRVIGIKNSHGEEGIELANGCRIRFKARTGGGGRGFSGDTLYLDEAMILRERFLGATIPILSARPNPQIWLAGSPPDEDDPAHDGIVLAKRRKRALAGGDPKLAYFEHSAEVGDDPTKDDPAKVPKSILDDPKRWAQANPGLGIRITEEFVVGERLAMGARQFATERLAVGKWPEVEDETEGKIPLSDWAACLEAGLTVKPAEIKPICFAIDVNPERTYGAIAAAGKRADGKWVGVVIKHAPTTDWIVNEMADLAKTHRPAAVIWDKKSQANSLATDLEAARIRRLKPIDAQDLVDACGRLYDAVTIVDSDGGRQFVHIGQEMLDEAVKGADERELGDRWAWQRRTSSVDITPVVAVTLALWGAQTHRGGSPMVKFR